MLHKNLPNSLKDVDTASGVVCFYASSFDTVDDASEVVIPGAFTKTLAEQGPTAKQPRIKHLYQHDTSAILSSPRVCREDSFGLYTESRIVPTRLGKDVLLLYEAGVITEHSFGYEVIDAQWDRTKGVRLLKQLRVFEVSSVTWGCNPETPTVGVKGLTDPTYIPSLATKAAAIDKLLHDGALGSDTLCELLERELKALEMTLAPMRSDAPNGQPYEIQGVLANMSNLADRLAQLDMKDTKDTKGASGKSSWPLGERDPAWDGGAAHKRIVAWATTADGSVDVAKLKSVHFYSPDDADDAQSVSKYKLLFCDEVDGAIKAMPRGIFACAGSHGVDATTGVSDDDKAAIKQKIEAYYAKMRKAFDDDTITVPWADDASDNTTKDTSVKLLIKGTGGDIKVSSDGTHAAYTGSHEHDHKAIGNQGDDELHGHTHTHDGDARHDHEHADDAKAADVIIQMDGKTIAQVSRQCPPHNQQSQPRQQQNQQPQTTIRKARDFDTLFASLNESDQLQDDWGDTYIALVQAMQELMWQSDYQQSGYLPEGAEIVDIASAAKANLEAFSVAALALVTRSIAADFVPMITCDRDQFIDPDGPNADDDDDDYDAWKNRTDAAITGKRADRQQRNPLMMPLAMPDPPTPLAKAGRAISGANRETITSALDGMTKAMSDMQLHHKSIADLMTKTDPDAVRQDEDNTQGDDHPDTENEGEKSRQHPSTSHTPSTSDPAPDRRNVTSQAGTTHQQREPALDLSALDADFDALKSRMRQTISAVAAR